MVSPTEKNTFPYVIIHLKRCVLCLINITPAPSCGTRSGRHPGPQGYQSAYP